MQMSARLILFFLLTLTAIQPATAQSSPAQGDPNITANGVIGEVKAIDTGSKQLVVKTDAGALVTVSLETTSSYFKLAPGEKTLTNATKITIADIGEGDRVYARGTPAEDHKSIAPRALIVMSKADIAKKQDAERAEWRRRGLLGVITALNPSSKEVTVSTRSMAGMQPVVIPIVEKVELRRYAPDSIKFSDAKASTFEELHVGDQIRALGERSADGTKFTPEKVVSGSFRTVAGTVTAVDTATGEIKINDLQTKQPLTIVIKQDAVLRKFSEGGIMFGQRAAGGERPPQGQAAQPAAANAQPNQAGGAGTGPGMRGGFNIQDMLERLPTITVADLKPGDTIIVSSTKGADAARLTAISLVSGADTLLNMIAARQQQPAGGQAPNPAAGLGSGFQFGIGLP
jgi:hypothetical protein